MEILPELEGLTKDSLPPPVILDIKRSKFKVEIVQKESDPEAKYEVFMRLNTGGSNLSDQELRNAWLVMYNKEFFEWLNDLSKNQDFKDTLGLSDKLISERYDLELIVAFLVYPNEYKIFSITDKRDGLTNSLRGIARRARENTFDYSNEKIRFENTFKFLNYALNENSFRKYYKDESIFRGGLLESLFEAVGIGLSMNIDKYDSKVDVENFIKKVKDIWSDSGFTQFMGSGTNSKKRIPNVIPFGIKYFSK